MGKHSSSDSPKLKEYKLSKVAAQLGMLRIEKDTEVKNIQHDGMEVGDKLDQQLNDSFLAEYVTERFKEIDITRQHKEQIKQLMGAGLSDLFYLCEKMRDQNRSTYCPKLGESDSRRGSDESKSIILDIIRYEPESGER